MNLSRYEIVQKKLGKNGIESFVILIMSRFAKLSKIYYRGKKLCGIWLEVAYALGNKCRSSSGSESYGGIVEEAKEWNKTSKYSWKNLTNPWFVHQSTKRWGRMSSLLSQKVAYLRGKIVLIQLKLKYLAFTGTYHLLKIVCDGICSCNDWLYFSNNY